VGVELGIAKHQAIALDFCRFAIGLKDSFYEIYEMIVNPAPTIIVLKALVTH